ncbi:MAG: hypothetical protein GEV08_19765 [Acidimicrobiia bacterium]|nr:hypothetical protein [Acidimicrobiia bacterium]
MPGKKRDRRREQGGGAEDAPTARQLLHWATGDRDAEAEALAEAAGDEVSEEDAELAVKRAHGDLGSEEPAPEGDVATPADAEHVHEERRG